MSTATAKPLDLKSCFSAAGYSLFSFTPEEQAKISAKIKKLMDEGKSQRQAVAIAISMIAPSKAKGEAEGSFAAIADGIIPDKSPTVLNKIQIKGGDYSWRDTGDGYKVIYSVPIMATVKKGVKGAPYDVDRSELEHYVAVATQRYHEDHFLATVFVDHNKDIEFSKPVFVGYVLPRKVDISKLENEEGEIVDTPTLYADLKIKDAIFKSVQAGEFPYHSPEVPWAKRRISGLALLNTKPPFFEFPNFTIGQQVLDTDKGTFEGDAMQNVKPEPIGRFDADGDADAEGGVKKVLKSLQAQMSAMEAKYEARMSAFEGQFAAMKKKFEGEAGDLAGTKVASTGANGTNPPTNPAGGTSTPVLKGKAEGEGEGDAEAEAGKKGKRGTFAGEKPNPLPVEPKAPAAMDAHFVAQFEATQSRLKILEDERQKEKDEATKESRIAWAMGELKGKIVSSTLKGTLGQFAADEPRFKAIVEEMKKSLPNEPPKSMADFKGVAVEPTAPSVAKFANLGPEQGEMAAKFAAQYREMKRLKWPTQQSEEQFVKFQMEAATGLSA